MGKGVAKGVGVEISQPTRIAKDFVRDYQTFNIS